MEPVREWKRVDSSRFGKEIVPLNRPAIMRGLVNHWPAVNAARESPQALAELLRGGASDKPIGVYYGEPAMRGRFFYGDEFQGFNFTQRPMPVGELVTQLVQNREGIQGPSLYAGAVSVAEHAPHLAAAHTLELLDPSIPRKASLWIGNRTRVCAHFDESQNVICVITGRRRYTLFSPDQARNLYFGPLDRSPAGTPVSLVDFAQPDYQRFPRFRTALENAEVAELEPGDALYLPAHWVHHAESLDTFGMMMNFWWHIAPRQLLSPYFTLMHSLLTIRGLSDHERAAWRAIFDVYAFAPDSDPAEYLPAAARGVLDTLTPSQAQQLIAMLQESLELARRNAGQPKR
jgi:hypothetical protein